MAANKRANKRKRTNARKRGKATSQNKPFWRRVFVALLLVICGFAATYHLGSFERRTQMEQRAMQAINAARSPEWMPRPVVSLLNAGYDVIPGSQGLAVEGGELGHEDSRFIAGVPQSKAPVRVLRNKSYTNLFDEQKRQATCIAFKLSDRDRQNAPIPDTFFEDPRIKQLSALDMRRGQWAPKYIAPAAALAGEYGEMGANEACLVTNLAPMSETFSEGLWQQLMNEITINYPKRFGEVWITLGPVLRSQTSKLDSGVPVANNFYAIVFDLTDAGGLRAIAFLLPHDTEDTKLQAYITSIDQIEALSGLEFLPEVDYHAREVLGAAVSPQLW